MQSLEVVARLELAVVAELYRRGSLSVRETIGALESSRAWTPGLPESVGSAIWELVAALDLAEYGSYGTVDDVRLELERFVADHPLPSSSAAPPAG